MKPELEQKRPRTASKAVRRRQLIEATIESIARHGLSGTTMATVTGIADLSMGIVSFHFESKENLLKETLTFLAQEHRSCWMTRLEASDQSPGGQLRAIVEAHFDPSICTPDRIAVWFAFFGEMRYRKTYRERISEFDRERQRRTEDLCRVLIAAEGPNYLDAAEVAEALESFADGLWLNIMLYPECLSPESARNHIHAYLAGMFPASFGRRSPVSIRSVG